MGPRPLAALAALLAAALGAAGLTAGTASAWPGDPDGAWGACGTRTLSLVGGDSESAAAAVLQPDGALVLAGHAGTRALVARLLADGSPDPGFGSGGSLRFGPGTHAELRAVALTATGRIVVAGSRTSNGASDTLVARVRPDGTLDKSFNGSGTRVTNVGGQDVANAVQVSGSGAMVVGGRGASGKGFVLRHLASGAWDTAFGTGGKRTDLPFSVDAMVMQPDGAIVVGGRTVAGADIALMRLLPDGSTDATFGGPTGVSVDLGGVDGITALGLQPDGRVVAAGYGHGPAGRGHTVVRRFTTTGAPDPSFTVTNTSFGQDDRPAALTVLGDGRFVLAGNSTVGPDNDVVVARFLANGKPDPSFGIGGATVADVGRKSLARALVSIGGRPLVLGTARAANRDEIGLFRFQPDAATAPYPGQGFVVDAYGGLHGFGIACSAKPAAVKGGPYWNGWDIVRGVAVLPGDRGVVLDGYGGLHRFGFAGESAAGWSVKVGGYWPGWDIARGVAVVPEGTGGYVVDAYGGLHPFRVGSAAAPPRPSGLPYWPGQDVARGVALLPDGSGGYVLDRSGGLHRFGSAPPPTAGSPYWPGQDRARGIAIAPDGSGGWIVDAFGTTHPFGVGGNAPPARPTGTPSWPGFPIARGIATLP